MDARHHLTLVCRDLAQVGRFARMDNWQFRIVRQGTPGSFTFLLPATAKCRAASSTRNAARSACACPIIRRCSALLAELDEPILSSTLILPGEDQPLNDAADIEARLGGRIDAIIDAGPVPASPTTVVDLAVSAAGDRAPRRWAIRRGLGSPADDRSGQLR